jgi:hypothetical protein
MHASLVLENHIQLFDEFTDKFNERNIQLIQVMCVLLLLPTNLMQLKKLLNTVVFCSRG